MDDQLGALTVIFTEFYYWVTVVLMFLIHASFLTLTGGESQIGIENVNVAISISVSAPTGTVLELKVTPCNST